MNSVSWPVICIVMDVLPHYLQLSHLQPTTDDKHLLYSNVFTHFFLSFCYVEVAIEILRQVRHLKYHV